VTEERKDKARRIVATYVMALFGSLAAMGFAGPTTNRILLSFAGALFGAGLSILLWPTPKKPNI